jgi:hypothetical protein
MRVQLTFTGTVVLAVGLAVALPDLMIKPGELTAGHRALDRDCLRCHTPLQGAATESCLMCHALTDIGRRTTQGVPLPASGVRRVAFHAGLATTDCMACHALHLGTRHRRAPAFEHALLQEAVRADCAACHGAEKPRDVLHESLAGGCGACHGTAGWRPATFDHTRFFRFDAHHPAQCAVCHTDRTTFVDYTCYGCHEHEPARIAAEHREEGIFRIADCAGCHRSGEEDEAKGRRDGGSGGEEGEDDD